MSLTRDDLIEIIRLDNDGYSRLQIANRLGCGKSTVTDFLTQRTHKDFWDSLDDKPIASGVIADPEQKWDRLKGKRFVFTSAQNNTFVHEKFLQSLLNYCEYNDSQLIIGTYRYNKNAYSKGDEQDMDYWFDQKIRPYISDEDAIISDTLTWCGSLDVLPTAVNPLSGFQSYVKHRSGIIPHAKMQLESLPSGKGEYARMLYTTGTVTQRNYIQRKAGQKAAFHHVYGALAVEIDDEGDWFVRQLIAEDDTGCFYDLEMRYEPHGVFQMENHIEGINWGDVHVEKMSQEAANTGWIEPGNILDTLKPKHQLVHDVFDMYRRNHHNIKDPYHRFKMHVSGTDSVRSEVEMTANVLGDMMRDFSSVEVVFSNHPWALKRWLNEADYKTDPVNAEFFLELQLAVYASIRKGEELDVFAYACKLVNEDMNDVNFLGEDESFLLADQIECGQHGHNGNNGARGSVRAFQVLGKKHNTGHTHSASIKDGVWTAGSCMKAEDAVYAKGASSWSISHIVTYENAKRCMITVKNGKWRAE